MSKIKIKNFGPIKEGLGDDWIEIKKVTLFIGNQGSGKSTVAKLITTFLWIEKALVRGDYDIKWFSRKNKLKNQFLKYFRLENYFSSDSLLNTEIEFRGDAYCIKYQDGSLHIEEVRSRPYELPQIMYVPAERNFIANVRTPKALKLTSDYLVEFVTEFDNAKAEIKGAIALPINDVHIEHNKQNDIVYIKGKDYRIKLTEASSGYQSIVPLYLVSWFLSRSVKQQSENRSELMTSEQRERFRKTFQLINSNKDLTDEQRRIIISELGKQFTKSSFINIVEEPEQNLFPSSQRYMLNSLLEFNNLNHGNQLIMTSHSPYLINYLTLAVKAGLLINKKLNSDLQKKLYAIVPEKSIINSDSVVVYELDGTEGKIIRLEQYKGMPSDKNYLNENLAETNYLFDDLLQLEKQWQ